MLDAAPKIDGSFRSNTMRISECFISAFYDLALTKTDLNSVGSTC